MIRSHTQSFIVVGDCNHARFTSMAHRHKMHSLRRSGKVANSCPAVPGRAPVIRAPIGQPDISCQDLRQTDTCRLHATAHCHAALPSSSPERQHGQQLHSVVQPVQQLPVVSSNQRTHTRMRCLAANAAVSADAQAAAEQHSQHQVLATQPESDKELVQLDIVIKTAATADEVQAVAKLRAEAYYAEDHSRFAQSFKKQFAAQEAESLRQRTASSNGRPQLCDCLLAVQAGAEGKVVGCIDIRLPQKVTGMRALGVPEDDAGGCYLLNVVVDEGRRGQGIGKALMRAAMARAVCAWDAERLYTHVEADNEVACGLYKGCGFQEHSSEAKYANTSALGRLVLLTAAAADAPVMEDTLWSVAELGTATDRSPGVSE